MTLMARLSMATPAPVDATRDTTPEFWKRHLALAVDGLRAPNASPLPEPPLTARQHKQAMERFAEQIIRPEGKAVGATIG